MAKDRKNWLTPTSNNPVDLDNLKRIKDVSTVNLKCHCCHKDALARKPPPTDPSSPYIPITVPPTPGAGVFICPKCPPVPTKSGEPKKARGSNKPDPHLRVWCVPCLKTRIEGGFESAFFPQQDDGPWKQRREDCWHCATSEGNACHPSCPKVPVEDGRAVERAVKRTLETPEAIESAPPSKRQRTTALPAALPHAQLVVERKRNVQDLAAEVLSQGLFSSHPKAFVYFIPHFKPLKNGSFKLEMPKVTNPKYPRWVSMSRSNQTNGTGVLYCPTCSGVCIHVQVLQRVLELRNERPCKPPITPEAQFSHSEPLKLANGLEGFWAVLQGKEKWVLCGQKGESWVCQADPSESRCRHACRVLGEDYEPPVKERRYSSKTVEEEWQAIPLETPIPPTPEELTTLVCSECHKLYRHTGTIEEAEFRGCSHGGTVIHVCTPHCQQTPCCNPPLEQVSDNEEDDEKKDLVATWRRKRLLQRSAEGYFSQPPPVNRVAPCGYNWRRKTIRGATIYNDTDTVNVDLCVWHCTRKPINECCALQPRPKEFFFMAPAKMRVSHKVLCDEMDEIVYEGGTFQATEKRAKRRAHRRKGEKPPIDRIWVQRYMRAVLAGIPPLKLPQQPASKPWTPAIQTLLREEPVLACEPVDPKTLVGRTFWKHFVEDQKWWRGRVTSYTRHTKATELWPMYEVEYPSTRPLVDGSVDPNKIETMTWRDLKHRLNPPEELFEGDDSDEYWGPRDLPWVPDKPSEPKLTPCTGKQQPWPVCPDCTEYPEALYIDCREAHMLFRYTDLISGQPVPIMPITYPYPNRVVTPDVHTDPEKRKSILKGASKLVKTPALRAVLKRWSGHVPVKKQYMGKDLVEVAAPPLAPLDAADLEVLKELPVCVRALVEHIGAPPTCPILAYAPLFYHLGNDHSDAVLIRHRAQDVFVNLLVNLKLAGASRFIEIKVEWDEILQESAPSLRCILLSAVDGNQERRGFDLSDDSLKRQGTGYKVAAKTLRALAPLLQHLLHLSFETKDYITCRQASALLSNALGVECGDIWLDRVGPNTVLVGEPVTEAEALNLAKQIRELMSGPCRGASEGVLAGESYVINQHRLSSSNVYHRVFRDVPQYAGLDKATGMCIGGESWDKCITDEQRIVMFQEQGMKLTDAEAKVADMWRRAKEAEAKKKPPKAEKDETAGIMVVTCKHRFVYYYHILLRHESLRDVFTFLVTRFEHRPPRYVIYDNACELSRYCEGRWPEFFAETTFLTDRFHGANHLCSDEFKYNCHGMRGREDFKGPSNTSVSEQINELMKKFDRTEQRATINTGMLVYDFFIQVHNTDLEKHWSKMKCAQGTDLQD